MVTGGAGFLGSHLCDRLTGGRPRENHSLFRGPVAAPAESDKLSSLVSFARYRGSAHRGRWFRRSATPCRRSTLPSADNPLSTP